MVISYHPGMYVPYGQMGAEYSVGGSKYGQAGTTTPATQYKDPFRDIWSGLTKQLGSVQDTYAAKAAPVERAFQEAQKRQESAMAALAPGNIRAMQEGTAELAQRKGETLAALRSQTQMDILESLSRIMQMFGQMGGLYGQMGYKVPPVMW